MAFLSATNAGGNNSANFELSNDKMARHVKANPENNNSFCRSNEIELVFFAKIS